MADRFFGNWNPVSGVQVAEYRCGYCDNRVASGNGIIGNPTAGGYACYIRICPFCNQPTYFTPVGQVPGIAFGEAVESLPADIEALYKQARDSMSTSAYTPAVLACRKILMHIAVAQGAKVGGTFMEYVEYLASKGYVPPNGQPWVDHIRKKSNEANHDIVLMTQQDAEELILFLGMLLKFIYEFPNRVPKPVAATRP
jgi:hypothetical protein